MIFFPQTGQALVLGGNGWGWGVLGLLLLLLAGLGLCCWRVRRQRRCRRAARLVRERIQHASHDELVQGIQGLMLHLQAIAEGIPAQNPVREQLERWLDRADAMLLADRETSGRKS